MGQLPGEILESPSLEVLKGQVRQTTVRSDTDVAQRYGWKRRCVKVLSCPISVTLVRKAQFSGILLKAGLILLSGRSQLGITA